MVDAAILGLWSLSDGESQAYIKRGCQALTISTVCRVSQKTLAWMVTLQLSREMTVFRRIWDPARWITDGHTIAASEQCDSGQKSFGPMTAMTSESNFREGGHAYCDL